MDITGDINGSVNNPEVSSRLDVYYWEQILTGILIGVIAVLGIIGNSMIILAVSFSRKLQTSTNAFVTSLSVADLISSVFLFFYMIGVFGRNGWPLPQAEWLCAFTAFILYMCRGTSLYNMAAIAVNRLLLITNPSLYRKVFVSWKLVVCLIIPWIIVGGSISVMLLTGFSAFGYDKADLACAIDDDNSTVDSDLVSLTITLIAFPVPLLVTTVSYAWIYIYLKKHFRAKKRHFSKANVLGVGVDVLNMDSETPSSVLSAVPKELSQTEGQAVVPMGSAQRERISQKQIKITQNLFMVVCSLYLCFLPYFILIFVANSGHILFYTRVITIANSTINFVIYAGKHPDFKVVFGHMLKRTYGDIPQPSRFLKFLLSQNS